MRQRVTVGVTNHFTGRIRISDEIALSRRIAPGSFGVPMPSLNKEFRVLPICNRSPASFKNLFYLIGPKKDVGCIARNAIYGCAQRAKRTECVCHVAGSGVDSNGLR